MHHEPLSQVAHPNSSFHSIDALADAFPSCAHVSARVSQWPPRPSTGIVYECAEGMDAVLLYNEQKDGLHPLGYLPSMQYSSHVLFRQLSPSPVPSRSATPSPCTSRAASPSPLPDLPFYVPNWQAWMQEAAVLDTDVVKALEDFEFALQLGHKAQLGEAHPDTICQLLCKLHMDYRNAADRPRIVLAFHVLAISLAQSTKHTEWLERGYLGIASAAAPAVATSIREAFQHCVDRSIHAVIPADINDIVSYYVTGLKERLDKL